MEIADLLLTDRGTEFNGRLKHHECELYLEIEGIDYSKNKVRHPQSNGICERFHRTVQDEFYAVTLRKKIYQDLESLQADLDQWIAHYNEQRLHSGGYCFGKTPMQTFAKLRESAKVGNLTLIAIIFQSKPLNFSVMEYIVILSSNQQMIYPTSPRPFQYFRITTLFSASGRIGISLCTAPAKRKCWVTTGQNPERYKVV